MNHKVMMALWEFSTRFVKAWQEKFASLPQAYGYADLPSPCMLDMNSQNPDMTVWQPIKRVEHADFYNIEQGIELILHDDIKAFYSGQFAADMTANFRGQSISLVQVWNHEDWVRLQENILGHLVMQKRLKHAPTVFIASTDDDMSVISICNVTGEVIREMLGTQKRVVLTGCLIDFIEELHPEV